MAKEKIHVAGKVLYLDDLYIVPLTHLQAVSGVVQQVPKGLALVQAVKASGNRVEVSVTSSYPVSAVKQGTLCTTQAGKMRPVTGKGRYMEVATMLSQVQIPPASRKWVPPAIGRYTLQEASLMLGLDLTSVKYYLRKSGVPTICEMRGNKRTTFIRYDALNKLHDMCCPPDGYVRAHVAVKVTGLNRSVLSKLADKGRVASAEVPITGVASFKMHDLLDVLWNTASNGPSMYDRRYTKEKVPTRTIVFRINGGSTLGDLVDTMADSAYINNTLKGRSVKLTIYEDTCV